MAMASTPSTARKVHQGMLFKKGQINKSWKLRFFVLYDSRRLAYFEKETSTEPTKIIELSEVQAINVIPRTSIKPKFKPKSKGKVDVKLKSKDNDDDDDDDEPEFTLRRMESISVATNSDKAYSFQLSTSKRTFLLACQNCDDFNTWIDHLEKSIFGLRIFQGWLTKRGAYRKSWKKRWFVIYDTQEMRYYDDETRREPKGVIKLHEVLLMCPGDEEQYSTPYTIQLMTADRNWVLASYSQKERDEWFNYMEECMHGAKRLVTSHEGWLWKKGQRHQAWKKRYVALSKGWLFYFEQQFHCNKFKSIAFFSEAFFNQAFRLYVKGSIPLHQTTVQKMDDPSSTVDAPNKNDKNDKNENDQINDIETNELVNGHTVYVCDKQFMFRISTEKHEFVFAADSKHDLDKWFHAFHSTHRHSQTDTAQAEDHDDDTESTEYETVLDDSPVPNDDEEKGDVNGVTFNMRREVSKTFLIDLYDPNGNGKWAVDVEDEHITKQQSDHLRYSLGIESKKHDQMNE